MWSDNQGAAPEQDEWASTYRELGYEYDAGCGEWHRPHFTCVRCFCEESPHPPQRCVLDGEVVMRELGS